MNNLAYIIRPARAEDRTGLEAIAALTWGGTDYLPRYIDAWLADAEGLFVVAESTDPEHTILGAGKLTCFGPGEWWLEGLRTHAAQQGRGIGKAIHHHLTQAAQQRSPQGVLRLATSQENEAVIRMAKGNGFQEAARFLRYTASPIKESGRLFKLGPAALPAAMALLGSHGQEIDRRWVWRSLTAHRMAEYMAAGRVYGWDGLGGGLDGVIIAYAHHIDNKPTLLATYLGGRPGAYALLAVEGRRLAAQLDCLAVTIMLPVVPTILVGIEQAGFRRPKDNSGAGILMAISLSDVATFPRPTES
jgi:ribosomal protein S18 acetylase RimI-like enzyme